jgi:hypothetical protein
VTSYCVRLVRVNTSHLCTPCAATWFKDAIAAGECMGLFTNVKVAHDEDKIMPIFHKFMVCFLFERFVLC